MKKIGNVKHSHALYLDNQPFLLLLGDKSLNTTLPEATACELHLYSKFVGNHPQLTEIFKHKTTKNQNTLFSFTLSNEVDRLLNDTRCKKTSVQSEASRILRRMLVRFVANIDSLLCAA